MHLKILTIAVSIPLIAASTLAIAAKCRANAASNKAAARLGAADARSEHAGLCDAKELPDGEVPPPDVDGNFIIGPTHTAGAANKRARGRATWDNSPLSR